MQRWVSCALLALAATTVLAQDTVFVDSARTVRIDPARGADRSVDYAALVRFGPWDDRNYDLTAADLAYLAPNEAELHTPIPVFFRVAFRKARPDLPRTGPAQYPRSAFNEFRLNYGGYLVDRKLYTDVTWSGGRYHLDLRDGTPQTDAPQSEAFVSGEVRVTSPEGAAESAIKIHPTDTSKVVAGSNGPGGGQKMHYSTDGGDSWTEVSLPLGGTCCDPSVDWSSDGAYVYTTALGNCGFSCAVWFYRSDDSGQTWESLADEDGDPRREIATGGGDKEFLHVDKYGPSPYTDNLYVTWHDGNVMKFARSTDFGHTWETQTFSSLSADRGIGSDIATGPDGAVYYIWPGFNSKTIRLRKSTNGGATFGEISVIAGTEDGYDFAIPAMESRRVFIYVAADADLSGGPYHGSIYAAWTDSYGPEQGSAANNHARIQVGYSRDGGDTWTVTTPHELPPGGVPDATTPDRFHPWLGVGPDGAVYVAYYDTREGGSRSSVDFYYSRSTDGGQTWTEPEDLTSVTSLNISDGFEWGDYNGLDVVMYDLVTIFTDNRSESGGSGNSVDVYAAGLTAGTPAVCGNGEIEPGEFCDGDNLGGRTCSRVGCDGGTLRCDVDCKGFDTSQCTGCPFCGDGTCDFGENCEKCASDCVSEPAVTCGNGICETADGEDCVNCPSDCNGIQKGKPANRYCCGAGGGTNPVACDDSRCSAGGNTCSEVSAYNYCCGDGSCAVSGEDLGNCAVDCTPPSPGAVAPMTLGYDRVADIITIDFGAACEAAGHAVAYGELDRTNLQSYAWSGRECGLGAAGPYDWNQAGTPSSMFFVVVGTSASAEGSYGLDGIGAERPEDDTTAASCQQPQELLYRCD